MQLKVTMIVHDLPPDDGDRPGARALTAVDRADGRSWWSELPAVLRAIQVRLRMVIIFAVAFLVIGKWDTLTNYWERLTSFAVGESPQAVSGNTEYFCPMCPGVISDWPSKCPVCNMALVRRKKGGPVQLPDGVVSRMQYSPYRLQLAGVRTSIVSYLPLTREITAAAFVKGADISAEAAADEAAGLPAEFQLAHGDAAMLRPDHALEIHCPARPGQGPWSARVGSVRFDGPQGPFTATVIVHIQDPKQELSPGMEVSACFHLPVADLEPFRSQPTDPEPLALNEPRSVFVCSQHAEVVSAAAGTCPRDKLPLVEQQLAENERLRYWCPMHPQVTAREPGHKCDACGGMVLVPRVVIYRPRGEILVVPESAVIDTGKRHVVYVDRGGGMFEGVEVVVGPRADGFHSVVSGLQAGLKVASAGAFLLDAETRLNPNISTAYFGATNNPPTATTEPNDANVADSRPDAPERQEKIDAALAQLSPDDERAARGQRVCPVTRMPLGSMGKPEKMVVAGRVVFLCCAGCKQTVLDNPGKYLAPDSDHENPNQRP